MYYCFFKWGMVMKKILIVDDQQIIQELIKAVLVKNMPGYQILLAFSGQEAIKIAKEQLPETILLDIIMPEMDGYEVCRTLKNDKLTKHIPILLVSALGQNSEDRILGLNAGADAFLSKPFDNIELLLQVKVMLRIKDAEDLLRKRNETLEIFIKKLKKLNSELTLVEERERRRIAEYLHDGIGQILALTHMKLSSIKDMPQSPKLQKIVSESSDLINDAIIKSRLLTYDLSPPILYELGLIPAIRWKLGQIESKYGIDTVFKNGKDILGIKNDIRILLYRIISELLTNIVKHANAKYIEIEIKKDKKYIYITVLDNGQGFDYKPDYELNGQGGFGLFSINERLDSLSGRLVIESETKKGTKAIVIIPA